VTSLLDRYEELVALRLTHRAALREKLNKQGRVVLAIDGLQCQHADESGKLEALRLLLMHDQATSRAMDKCS
jgi:hypothetical protein